MARLDQLRLRDLLVLETIAQLGSLHATALRLHVSQPAVSQIVKGLETAFATRLLLRGQRGVTLTEAGRAALDHLRVARHALQAAQAAAAQPRAPHLRLGTLPLGMLDAVPGALTRLRDQVPGVRVDVTEGTVDGLWRQLHEGSVDAIVSRLPGPAQRKTLRAGMRYAAIGEERLVMVAPAKHPALRVPHLALGHLVEAAWILPNDATFTRLAFDTRFVREGLTPPQPTMMCAAFHSSLHLAAATGMLSVAPERALRHYASSLRLTQLPVPWDGQEAEIGFACRETGLAIPAIATLRECFLHGASGERSEV